MSKFKVGDKVEVVNNAGCYIAKAGDKGDIVGVDRSTIASIFDLFDVRTADGRKYSIYARRLRLIKEESNVFTKADLRTGHLVQTLKGYWYVVLLNTEKIRAYNSTAIIEGYYHNGFETLEKYHDNLIHPNYDGLTINKVAVVESPFSAIRGLKNKTSLEDLNGFKIIWERESSKVTKLRGTIKDLKVKLQDAERELEAIQESRF